MHRYLVVRRAVVMTLLGFAAASACVLASASPAPQATVQLTAESARAVDRMLADR